MKVALAGAPGSGKTYIAKQLISRLNKNHIGDRWCTVDRYVEHLNDQTGWPIGVDATYPTHMSIITERWKQEWSKLPWNTVTCGTIYESIIYAATRGFIPPVNEIDMVQREFYDMAIMQAIGAFAQQLFDYDALFYLPLQDRSEAKLHSWEGVVNAKLPQVMDAHEKFAVRLDGTNKQRIDRAFEIVRNIEATLASIDQPTV